MQERRGDEEPDMNDADKVHVVVGASGGTGSALVRELVSRGRQVRAVTRSGRTPVPEGVESVAGDATDADRMREVCRGAGVVYNAVNVAFLQWREAFPLAIDGVLAGAQAADARMVFVDDTWMYGRVSAAMTEDLPYRPVSNKGVLRAWLAERVLAAHANGRVRTVIGRAPELYGPVVESVLGRNLFGPAVGKGPAMWIGELDEPLGPMFIDDFAHGLADLGEHPAAPGRAWHIPTPPPTTARAFIERVFAVAGRPGKTVRLGPKAARAIGLAWPVMREGAEMLYQFRQPHSVDATAYLTSIGPGRITSYEQGIEQTLKWYLGNRTRSVVTMGR
jgi:nucleoside-diphosphate-sugar epimerase